MIPIYKPFFSELESKYLNQALESGWISNKGEFIDRFKSLIKDFLKVDYVVLTHNGSVSLMLGLAALGLKPGDEIVVPSLTYMATISQPIWLGLKVVLFDSEMDFQPSFESFRKVLSNRTKCLILPSLYNGAPSIFSFIEECKVRGISVFEDAAEAFGSTINGNYIGTMGDIGSFSFFGNKTITTGEGGCVVTNNKLLYDRLELLNNQSHVYNFEHAGPGFNFRMTNLQAAIGCAQLENIDEILKRKKAIANLYSSLPDYIGSNKCESAEWMPLFRGKLSYKHIAKYATLHNIDTRPCFKPAHLTPGFRDYVDFSRCNFPISSDIYSYGYNLPCFPGLTEEELLYITETVRNI